MTLPHPLTPAACDRCAHVYASAFYTCANPTCRYHVPVAKVTPAAEMPNSADLAQLCHWIKVAAASLDDHGRFTDAGLVRRGADVLAMQAARIAALEGERQLLTHKVITCGVAASHSDAGLSTRGEYGTTWNSQQAQEVRALRAKYEAAEAALAEARGLITDLAENGLRFSLNPCHDMSTKDSIETFWHGYMRSADEQIRERARTFLTPGARHDK
jgi:hypothetical protein